MPQKFSLSRIPIELVVEILNKLRVKKQIRMRKTCKWMDDLVEKNRKKFASRPLLGIDLYISCNDYDDFVSFYYQKFTLYKVSLIGKRWIDVQRRLSGISVNCLKLKCGVGVRSSNKMNAVIKEFRPNCHIMSRCSVHQDYIASIVNNINVLFPPELKFTIKFSENSSFNDGILREIAKTKYHSTFYLNIENCGFKLKKTVFERVKHFASVSVSITLNAFHELLWDIYNSKEVPAIKSLSVAFRNPEMHSSFPFTSAPMPPFTPLQGYPGSYEMFLPSQKLMIFETLSEHTDVVAIELSFRNLR